MTFETMGDRSHPAVLLIHGMLCNAESSKAFGKYLADEYFVIMPTTRRPYPSALLWLLPTMSAKVQYMNF